MLSKWFLISLLALEIQNISAGNYIRSYIPDISKFNTVFYNLNTQSALKGVLENVGRDPIPGIGFRGIECNCNNHTCGCCSGINITKFNFDRRLCINLIYIPKDFAIKLNCLINEKEIFNRTISAKNPEPFCIPAYAPFLNICVRVFDIYTMDLNLHACIDLEAIVMFWPVLTLHFDCMKVGTDGFSWMKPENNSSLPQIAELAIIMPEVNGPEIYDQVDFEPESPEFLNNHTSSLTPEEEDNIGQLKL